MDPIVKQGSERLTAADVLDYLERHPGALVIASGVHGKRAAIDALERRREHHGEGRDFEPPNDGRRTDVR